MKTLTVTIDSKSINLIPVINPYAENMTTRLDFIDASDGHPYSTLSTNLSVDLPPMVIFVDIEGYKKPLYDELIAGGYLEMKKEADGYALCVLTTKLIKLL